MELNFTLAEIMITFASWLIAAFVAWFDMRKVHIANKRADDAEERAKYHAAISELLSLSSDLYHHIQRICIEYLLNPEHSVIDPNDSASLQELASNTEALTTLLGDDILSDNLTILLNSHTLLVKLTSNNSHSFPVKLYETIKKSYMIFRMRCHEIALKDIPLTLKSFAKK